MSKTKIEVRTTALADEVLLNKIYEFRGQKVMLDSDLAELYEVETKVLKQAIRRSIDRFPEDFMFELDENEFKFLRSQIVTSKTDGRGGSRYFIKSINCFLPSLLSLII